MERSSASEVDPLRHLSALHSSRHYAEPRTELMHTLTVRCGTVSTRRGSTTPPTENIRTAHVGTKLQVTPRVGTSLQTEFLQYPRQQVNDRNQWWNIHSHRKVRDDRNSAKAAHESNTEYSSTRRQRSNISTICRHFAPAIAAQSQRQSRHTLPP